MASRLHKKNALTPRQEAFVKQYLIDRNGKQAAIRAGYSPKGAEVQASALLRLHKVSVAVDFAIAKQSARLEITADRVLSEMAKLAYSNIGEYLGPGNTTKDLSTLPREQLACIQEVTVDEYGGGSGDGQRKKVCRTRFKLADKAKALDMLGRHLKLFTDKSEVELGEQTIQALLEGRKRVGKGS